MQAVDAALFQKFPFDDALGQSAALDLKLHSRDAETKLPDDDCPTHSDITDDSRLLYGDEKTQDEVAIHGITGPIDDRKTYFMTNPIAS